ncbi:hypothetical protein M3223_02580 [Paenibacillus pasadenensis]|uniref:hypothetical protein n=1 Tax=Paenibacillus pasadenensis TaxID=217090 RepID=UPI00203BBA40|nr:hypothetical protein [Paenibacillus pasadenensis]MCM3746235.1 hypothetical protein [Paenibacillus pasadenensis]
MEIPRISSVNGKSLGIILVLFILLVIVTSVFSTKYWIHNNSSVQSPDDDSVDIAATQTFAIVNYSRFRLGLDNISGDASPPTPSITLLPYEGINEINLTIYRLRSSSSNAIYRSREFRSESLSFTLERIIGFGLPRITNIVTTGEIEANVSSVSSFRLIINDIQGGIYEPRKF